MDEQAQFQAILDELNRRAALDPQLRRIMKKIEKGKANFTDTAALSQRMGNLLGELFGAEVLDIPEDAREAVCEGLLQEQYDSINEALADVQGALDEPLGLHLTPQKAPFPSERVQQLAHALIDPTVAAKTIQRRADKPVATVAKSFHDDYMKENAKIRAKLGFKCYLNRVAAAGCCKWCTDIAGRYVYGDHPNDIFRRHDNCDCTVTFENGRERQDVWSKRTWQESPADVLRDAKAPVRYSAEQAEILQENAASRLTLAGERDIIKLNDSAEPLFPVTDASLSKIPKVTAFKDERINRTVEEQCKAILEAVKDDKIGTECTVSIRLSDLYFESQKGGQGDGTVAPIKMDQPFISIHNHASNKTISPRDARILAMNPNCYAIVVIGNKGNKIYILQKEENFDADSLMKAISEKIKPENSNITDDDFLRGCEQYGTKYFG